MNFEHLCKMIKENNHRLKDKDKTLIFINNIIRILKKNIKRLKLGKVVFEFKKIIYADIVIYEEVEMRYIRQDTTRDDELKIENRLEALKWRTDFKNIMALIIVVVLTLILIYAHIYTWYCNNLPTIAYRNPDYDEAIEASFTSTLVYPCVGPFKKLININYLMASMLSQFCIQFNMIF